MKIFFRRIHLWLSLSAGLIIMTCCITGAILVFQKELEQAFYHERYFTEAQGKKLSAGQLLKAVKENNPKAKINGIKLYSDPSRTTEVNVTVADKNVKQPESKPAAGATSAKPESRPPSLTVFVDPYSGRVIETYNPREGFFFQVMSLHRWLLGDSDGIGKTITGIATLVFLFILITGIILWWPMTKNILLQRLKIKNNAGWKRLNHDLHIVLGFYSAIILFIFAFTALAWSFEWFNNGIYSVTNSPLQPPPAPKSNYIDGVKPVGYDVVLQSANAVIKGAAYYNISKPKDSTAAFTVSALSSNAPHESATDMVYVDQYSGKVIGTMLFSERSTGSQVRSTFKPVHTGSIYGTPSKIIALLVCIFGASFPVTGVIMWINRTRKKRKPVVVTQVKEEILV